MTLASVSAERAGAIVSRFADTPILVVGDVMLDRFIVGEVSRISPEAPVPVVRFQSEHVRLGGAANVAHNLASLGAQVSLVGVVGRDAAADTLRGALKAAGLDDQGLVVDVSRPTVEKVRVVTSRNQQVARIDYEQDGDVSGVIERGLVDHAKAMGKASRALLVSDYLKGSITSAVVDALRVLKASGVPLVIDPKIPHLHCYAGATLVTPNHHEAERATNRRIQSEDEARDAGRAFKQLASCDAVLITRGDQGMWLSSPGAEGAMPSVSREVADVTGAGDTVAAVLTLALAVGATLTEAAVLANHAAGIVVARFGPATTTGEELLGTFLRSSSGSVRL